MGISNLGTKKTVEKITLTDLKNYYAEFISPNITNVVVVGDLKKDEVLNKLSFLKDWKNANTVLPKEPESPVNNKTKIYFVNKKDAAQSVIRIGHMSMAHDAYGDFYKSKIMNYTLGAAFNSRLNMSLREEHGYTYGARSGYYGNDFKGPFIAHSSVRGDVTDSAISVFMDEITAYVENGITQEELDFTKNSIEQKEALKYETNMQKVGFINRILVFDLEADFVKKQKEILSTITKTEIDKMAKKHLPYNNFVILVVGDKKLIYDKLLKLNYEVVELDLRGNLIK
jgi:zinc protease